MLRRRGDPKDQQDIFQGQLLTSFTPFANNLLSLTFSFLSFSDVFLEEIMDDVRHIIMLRKNAAAMIFIAGILFGLMITPVLKLLAVCLYNSFLQEPDSDQNYEDEGLGKDEVDEDEEVEEKKER